MSLLDLTLKYSVILPSWQSSARLVMPPDVTELNSSNCPWFLRLNRVIMLDFYARFLLIIMKDSMQPTRAICNAATSLVARPIEKI